MAEIIIRYIPRITVCLEEIAKKDDSHDDSHNDKDDKNFERYKGDILKLADEMDIRKQENINLKFQINRLEDIIENRK